MRKSTGRGGHDSPSAPTAAGTSTRPYLIRALHEWCTENGFTPYPRGAGGRQRARPAGVCEERRDRAQRRFRGDERLKLGNEFIEFKARFGGVRATSAFRHARHRDLRAENGRGMAFPAPTAEDAAEASANPGVPGASGPAHLTLADGAKADPDDEPPDRSRPSRQPRVVRRPSASRDPPAAGPNLYQDPRRRLALQLVSTRLVSGRSSFDS